MGIRFYCPNGHRLHVKDFQAGKRGICPHCAARFRIPRESEIPKGAPRLRPHERGTPPVGSPLPEVGPAGGTLPGVAASESPAVGTAVLAAPAEDPIAQAPAAVWYVRPPSGGEFGPAAGDVMQRWLDEGRISVDTLVWREGWPEWLPAGPLFPQLSSARDVAAPDNSSPGDPEAGRVTIVIPEATRSRTSRSAPAAQRRPETRSKSAVAVVVTLLSMVLVLLVVLVLVVRGAA